ncbi:msx2-interacting protein-like [Daphnia magna]|uniref:msx2-interacting protein-like n=1 Tax=Daphnia magna TaxID=35525 RepID=UPI001E1BCAAF|nr:msx2-interacting protein-like [Daphnia magna]
MPETVNTEISVSETNRVADVETTEVLLPSAQEPSKPKPKKSRIESTARKCHTRVRDPNFISESDNESRVSASKALPRKKAPVKSKVADTVSLEENTTAKCSSENFPAKKTQSTGKKSKTKKSTKTISNGKKELPTSNELNSSDSVSADALIEKILAESRSFTSMATPGTEKPKAKVTRRKLSTDSRPSKKAKISEEPIDVALSVEEIMLKYSGDDSTEGKSKDITSTKRSKFKAGSKPLGESSAMDKKSSPKKNIKVPNPEATMKTSATAKKKSAKKMTSVAQESFSEEFDPLSFVEELLHESHGASRNSMPPTSPPKGKPVKGQKASVQEPKSVAKRPSKQRKALS